MEHPWIALDTQEAIDHFMTSYGYFHDGCLAELRYVSGTDVDPDTLGMQPCANLRSVNLVFHRQFRDPCHIEMRFDGLDHLTLRPFPPLYTSEIHQARLRLHNGKIEWFSNHIDDEESQYASGSVAWLSAEHGWWRPIA